MKTYEQILEAQNEGIDCPHCKSSAGHYSYCPLINRNVAEACAVNLSPEDALRVRGLGVIWEGA